MDESTAGVDAHPAFTELFDPGGNGGHLKDGHLGDHDVSGLAGKMSGMLDASNCTIVGSASVSRRNKDSRPGDVSELLERIDEGESDLRLPAAWTGEFPTREVFGEVAHIITGCQVY